MNPSSPEKWNRAIRWAFWIGGIVTGAINAYAARYFINGDAIAYIEMGECLRTGEWARLANLTYSPGYPVLLGIGQVLFDTNPMNELQVLRIISVVCLILAMGACDLLMRFVRREISVLPGPADSAITQAATSALCYSMFLLVALEMIRVRLLNPDMLVFAIVVFGAAVILWIRENPGRYGRFLVLGLVLGVGYLTKSFLFIYSWVYVVLAGMCCQSVKRAIPRVLVAVVAMLVVASPLIASLSMRAGRLTYGELGRHVYATVVSGKGQPVHPELLHQDPRVMGFAEQLSVTRPSGFDICYWHLGLDPHYDMAAHFKVILGSVLELFTQTTWLIYIAIWFVLQAVPGFVVIRPWRFPSQPLLLGAAAVLGIGLYCLIRMEPRYIGPYVFLGFVGLTALIGYPAGSTTRLRTTLVCSGLLIGLALGNVVLHSVDGVSRGLQTREGKLSYKDAFGEIVSVKELLLSRGLVKGDFAAVVGSPPDYWARMAGLRISSEVMDKDRFLGSGPAGRKGALEALAKAGVKAVVAKGPEFSGLDAEGWQQVPGTQDFFVLFLSGAQQG